MTSTYKVLRKDINYWKIQHERTWEDFYYAHAEWKRNTEIENHGVYHVDDESSSMSMGIWSEEGTHLHVKKNDNRRHVQTMHAK